jgi:HD superfamily phosphohydrolase YqeK
MARTTKSKILELLGDIERPGMPGLLAYLESSDFFTAPASTRFHAAYSGGLADHSLSTYSVFEQKVKTYGIDLPADSVKLCGLLHDVCKIGLYHRGKRNVKENGKWVEKEVWVSEDILPLGHGEKSVYLIQKHIQLTDLEALAIRWHMGLSEPRELWDSLDAARGMHPAIMALHIADMESSFLAEEQGPQG